MWFATSDFMLILLECMQELNQHDNSETSRLNMIRLELFGNDDLTWYLKMTSG
jgi:hypothetical protein